MRERKSEKISSERKKFSLKKKVCLQVRVRRIANGRLHFSPRGKKKEKKSKQKKKKKMTDDGRENMLAGEEVDAVFAAALKATKSEGGRGNIGEVPPPPPPIPYEAEKRVEEEEEEERNAPSPVVMNVPPPPLPNKTTAAQIATATTAMQPQSRAISTFIKASNEEEKIITQTEKEEEKLAMTAREAFLATFANYNKKNRSEQGEEDGRRKMTTLSSSEAVKLKNPPPDPVRLQSPYGLIDASKCTATGTLVSGCKKNETAKVYVQMRDEIGNALMKPKKEEEEMMEKCGKMTVEGRVLLASTTKENVERDEFDTFELKVMDGKYLVYYGEYRPLERGTYNVYVDVVFSDQRNPKNNGRFKIEGSPFPVYCEDAGGAHYLDNGTGGSERERSNNTGDLTTPNTIVNTSNTAQNGAHGPPTGINGSSSFDIGGGISVENDRDDKRTVHVANLSIAMNQDALVQLMSHVGTVVATKMGGEGKTYAFVEFLSHEQARTAKGLNGMEIGGRSLKVEFSKQSRLIGTTTNVVIHHGPQQQLALEQEQRKKEREREEKERARNQMREERERQRAQELLAAEKSKRIYSNPNVRHQIEMQKVLEGKTEEEILLERARAQKRMKPDQPGKLMTAAERAAKRAQEISARLNANR
jgi:hypothetical protein